MIPSYDQETSQHPDNDKISSNNGGSSKVKPSRLVKKFQEAKEKNKQCNSKLLS